jgi:hypothetical protein
MSSPVNVVKERFGDKAKLVAAIEKLAKSDLWLDRINDEKGLSRVSNAKLLHLHDTLSAASKEFGSRKKLIDAILELENRKKDAGLREKLEARPLPMLLDLHRAAQKHAKARAAAPKPAAKKKLARSKKAQAKAKAK